MESVCADVRGNGRPAAQPSSHCQFDCHGTAVSEERTVNGLTNGDHSTNATFSSAAIKAELQSIASLIQDLLCRQAELTGSLSQLEPQVNRRSPYDNPAPCNATWLSTAKMVKHRLVVKQSGHCLFSVPSGKMMVFYVCPAISTDLQGSPAEPSANVEDPHFPLSSSGHAAPTGSAGLPPAPPGPDSPAWRLTLLAQLTLFGREAWYQQQCSNSSGVPEILCVGDYCQIHLTSRCHYIVSPGVR